MTIGIDITPLSSGHQARGIGVYTKNLISSLMKISSPHRFIEVDRKKKVHEPLTCLHIPYFDPFFLTLPWFSRVPLIVTVHDLIPLRFPENFPRGVRGELKWQIQKFFLSRVKRIITDSQTSKHDITEIIGFDENRIDVIPLAPSPVFRRSIRSEDVKKITKKIADKDPYILFVGDVNWNKNIPRLTSAFRKASDRLKKITRSLKLVCVGKAFLDDSLPEVIAIRSLIRDLHMENAVVMPGYVDDDTLHALYRGASATIVPSLYEGFGFPVLEAMASGCVVVSSDAGSLSEIVGPSIIIDPMNIESMADGIVKALMMTETERSHRLTEQKLWSSQFTWEKVASRSIASYEKIL